MFRVDEPRMLRQRGAADNLCHSVGREGLAHEFLGYDEKVLRLLFVELGPLGEIRRRYERAALQRRFNSAGAHGYDLLTEQIQLLSQSLLYRHRRE